MTKPTHPVDALLELAEAAGHDVDHEQVALWRSYCDAPVEYVQTTVEGAIGECEPAPSEVTHPWRIDQMTRH